MTLVAIEGHFERCQTYYLHLNCAPRYLAVVASHSELFGLAASSALLTSYKFGPLSQPVYMNVIFCLLVPRAHSVPVCPTCLERGLLVRFGLVFGLDGRQLSERGDHCHCWLQPAAGTRYQTQQRVRNPCQGCSTHY